jgi:hypothetical protein
MLQQASSGKVSVDVQLGFSKESISDLADYIGTRSLEIENTKAI